jgi:hypothetical protein
VQVGFNPQDTTNLSPAFHSKPLAAGVVVICAGGQRQDHVFTAWLMAGELGLPLVQAPVSVAGCVAFIDGFVPSVQPLPSSVVVFSVPGAAPAAFPPADIGIAFAAATPAPPPTIAAPAGPAERIDPACNFGVVIGDVSYGLCQVSTPASVAYGSRGNVYPNLILRRAITLDASLWVWRMNIVHAQADVRSMVLQHLDATGKNVAIRTWWIEGAWPVRWTGPTFDSMTSALAMEEVEICISRFDWLSGGNNGRTT